jgi:hypothetical protein
LAITRTSSERRRDLSAVVPRGVVDHDDLGVKVTERGGKG